MSEHDRKLAEAMLLSLNQSIPHILIKYGKLTAEEAVKANQKTSQIIDEVIALINK